MPLLKFDAISIAFGHHQLLDHSNLVVDKGERICLIGRNGEGKSTLLKIIEGVVTPDSGEVWRQSGLRLARLEQDLPVIEKMSVFEFVSGGLSELGQTINAYHQMADQLAHTPSEANLKQLDKIQHELEANDGWRHHQQVQTVLSRLQLDPDKPVETLSGGWRRRASLARALVCEPDLLLLDEPTNHLDVEAIQWLEDKLAEFRGGLLFVTHDRALLQRLATRIIELDRGQLTSWSGGYQEYLKNKEAALESERTRDAKFDKKLATEERWIRQGIKARRTRNEGRVRTLTKLRQQRAQRRGLGGQVKLVVDDSVTSGKLAIEVKNMSFAYGNFSIVENFSLRLLRGDRIGLIGPNGVGKTTLFKLLLKEIEPDEGSVRHGTRLQIAHFDQLREHLDLETSVVDNLNLGSDRVEINGKQRHAISYLGDFLFAPERARSPVKSLSGGERNRLLLARLFTRPANFLVLDEPTNDLDIETLELLEAMLVDYSGTLLIVSHDRIFLDNVVTSTLVFEGNGSVKEYLGGYQDWAQHSGLDKDKTRASKKPRATAREKQGKKPDRKKLSYKQSRELGQLPGIIEALESEQATLSGKMAQPDFYQQSEKIISETAERAKQVDVELRKAYESWEGLESL